MIGPLGTGVWAFNIAVAAVVGPPKPQTAPAFSVGGTGPSAEWWTITLASWRPQNGANRALINVFTPGSTKLQLELSGGGEGGAGSATETVIVDYPQQGAVFSISAVQLRATVLYSPAGTNENPPLLSGWVARGPRAGGGLLRPTFTSSPINISSGGTVNVPVPARARFFRWMPVITGATSVVASNQFTGSAVAPTQLDIESLISSIRQFPDSREDWLPLHPDCASISFTSTGGVASGNVQFGLEL